MRKYIFLLLLSAASFFVKAQSADAIKITQTLQTQTIAWNNGDLETFMQPYWHSDSLVFIGKTGITFGWLNTLTNYKKGYPDKEAMGNLQFDIIQLKQLDANYISLVGKWKLSKKPGNLSGHFTLLWKKIKDEWVIIMDHSS